MALLQQWHSAAAAQPSCFKVHFAAAILAVDVALHFAAKNMLPLFITKLVDCTASHGRLWFITGSAHLCPFCTLRICYIMQHTTQ